MDSQISETQKIFVFESNGEYPEAGMALAKSLSDTYSKGICILTMPENNQKKAESEKYTETVRNIASQKGIDITSYIIEPGTKLNDALEKSEASMLVFEVGESTSKSAIKKMLDITRQLRIPYFFTRKGLPVSFEKVLVPVTFLIEDREKGPFSSSLGRFYGSEIMLMTAKDYGSKAKATTNAISELLDKAGVRHSSVDATKDSFKVQIEASEKCSELGAGLMICTASRDYGLDDIIFGPPELKVIRRMTAPVMMLNPRGDLYALCG